jgi:hypothetical protein
LDFRLYLLSWNFLGVSEPECFSSSSAPFSNYSFLVHHLVNREDWHLLAWTSTYVRCMAIFSCRTIGFSLKIKLHTYIHTCIILDLLRSWMIKKS